VIERFVRAFKEQVLHGRIYQTIDEVREAVRTFVAHYNAPWLIDKNAYQSPNDARSAGNQATFTQAA